VDDGPYPPGTLLGYTDGTTFEADVTYWAVWVDGIGENIVFANEEYLFPIDDGDPEATPTEHELETTT